MVKTTDYPGPAEPVEESLKKRYFFKLSANLIGMVIGLVTASLIPRGLGPSAYGSFGFLSAFFNQVVSFLDSGTYLAFYTKLSQRPQETGLIRFYWGFTSLVSIIVVLFVSLVFALGWEDWLWPDQLARFIWLAVLWGLLTWSSMIVNHIVDAYGLTVGSELARMRQRVLGLILVGLMFWLNRFSLTEFFLYQYLIILFLVWSWWQVLRRAGLSLFPQTKLPLQQIKNYSREFFVYSSPLLVYGCVGLLAGLLDRWLLQHFAGSVEQGFYTLSYRLGEICFLFTGAMTPLLTREFSKAYGQHDIPHMQNLFQRYIPSLYVIAAYFSVFLSVQAEKASLFVGGAEFKGASLAVAIMVLYPIHQTYGQLSGSMLFATGQTKLYRNIGLFIDILFSLPLTMWLIAPSAWSGLALGATGLAIKMIVVQFISVNLQLWFNSHFLQLSYWKFLGHQLYVVGVLYIIAWLTATTVDQFIKTPLFAFLISGIIYTLGFILITILLPSLLFLSRAEMWQQLTQLKAKIANLNISRRKV